jgi:Protein of unknown function (DUF1269)
MADLIAIGYPDETTARSAMDEAERLQHELVIQTDAVAAIVRTKEGKIRTFTNHQAVGDGEVRGVFWGLLFGRLFFVPVLGMAVGAGPGALMAGRPERRRQAVRGPGLGDAPAGYLGAVPGGGEDHPGQGQGGGGRVDASRAIDVAICLGPALGAHRFVIGRLEPAQHKPTREDQQPQPLGQVRLDQRDWDR